MINQQTSKIHKKSKSINAINECDKFFTMNKQINKNYFDQFKLLLPILDEIGYQCSRCLNIVFFKLI